MGIDYDKWLFRKYHQGRAHDESVMQLWRDTIRRNVGDRTGLVILDLGAGTGRYSSLLAEELDSEVIGVEPSDKMRAVAEAECKSERVQFVKGSADAVPLDDDSIDMVWISQVLHHCPDVSSIASELSRVVRQTGLVLIRSNFQGRLKEFARFYDFFPTALIADEARHPSVEQVQLTLEGHGFRFVQFDTVEQMEAESLKDYAKRVRLRTYSVFELITDQEFDQGMLDLDFAAQAEKTPEPVMAKLELIVFERQG